TARQLRRRDICSASGSPECSAHDGARAPALKVARSPRAGGRFTSAARIVYRWAEEVRNRMPDLNLAVIGNSIVAALADRRARIVWYCLPRFDGDPVFSSLLDGDEPAGGFY